MEQKMESSTLASTTSIQTEIIKLPVVLLAEWNLPFHEFSKEDEIRPFFQLAQ